MSTVLGIDLGTQHLKAVVYDADARQIRASVTSPLALCQRDDGTAEQSADWWIEALSDALSQIDRKLKMDVAAIGVSGQQHGFVPINKDGGVLASVKLWCDTSTELECAEIMAAAGGTNACIASAGNPILPGYTASKILWLKETRQKALRRHGLHSAGRTITLTGI